MCLNTYGQDPYIGKIIEMSNPCTTDPCLPCSVLWLETPSRNYVLSFNSQWFCGKPLIVDNTEYFIDDEVEITGTVTAHQDVFMKEYFVLEIETIKKKTSNINSVSFNNKVYYDETKQVIVIDETLQNQSFITFELINMQGNTILKKSSISESINIANLPSGIYLCRILQNGRIIYSDKIVKK